jgi:succinyl-diaminopimelate desuccinylase
MNDLLNLTIELIRRPSISPEDEGCMDLIAERLSPLGFSTEWLNFGDTKNIFLRHGHASPLFVFLGHTDVVPPGPLEEWTSPPFEPTVREGKLYGRGAADMKSGVAAMTVALERFVADYPKHSGSVALLLTSDEEGVATHGIAKVVETFEARGEKIVWCVIGEPSSFKQVGDTLRIGRRGSLNGVLRILGTQGHVAYPALADNPIHRFAPALLELSQETWDQGNEFFPPTSFQICNIQAGTGAENVIPGRLDLLFNFRFSTAITEEQLKQRVQDILEKYQLQYELSWRLSGAPFLTSRHRLITATKSAIESIMGYPARLDTGGGTSDGRFVAPTGAEVVELGPLNGSIHKINEHVDIEEIDSLSKIYRQILIKLFQPD